MSANVSSAANRLAHTLREILDRWDVTKETWNDAVRRDFEAHHLAPLEGAVKVASSGMSDLADVLQKCRRDCSERNEY